MALVQADKTVQLAINQNLKFQISDFKFQIRNPKEYAKGVTSHSPGLPRQRLPWVGTKTDFNPEGVAQKATSQFEEPLQGSSY
jgi:hypothetical protein